MPRGTKWPFDSVVAFLKVTNVEKKTNLKKKKNNKPEGVDAPDETSVVIGRF